MWLKAIRVGNYVGWPMLMEHNVQKYYPEATKMAKGHLNQTRKNVCSTKKNLSHSRHATPLNSMAKKCVMYTPKRTRLAKPCSLTKQASPLHVRNEATNTAW